MFTHLEFVQSLKFLLVSFIIFYIITQLRCTKSIYDLMDRRYSDVKSNQTRSP